MRALLTIPLVLALFDGEGDLNPDDAKAAEKAAKKALRDAVVNAIKEAGAPNEKAAQKAASALLKQQPDVTPETMAEVVDAFKVDHPELFIEAPPPEDAPQSAPPATAPRYIVETTTVFELLGSTVTFREGQIVREDTREYAIARDFDVPLRPLAPIVR